MLIFKYLVFCEAKNLVLKEKRPLLSFIEIISIIEEGNFIVCKRVKGLHENQFHFLIQINEWFVVVPFNEHQETIQLITFFPERRLKRILDAKDKK